jgi:hypothetical protein
MEGHRGVVEGGDVAVVTRSLRAADRRRVAVAGSEHGWDVAAWMATPPTVPGE